MAVYNIAELRGMTDVELEKKLDELNLALLEAGSENPKRNREIRKAMARIKTLQNEKKKA